MTGTDLMQGLENKNAQLDVAISALSKRGRAKAEAARVYDIAFAEMMLRERDKSTPATLIDKICRGDKHIAQLKFERDCAETAYEVAQEAINAYKLQIRILDAQIEREWGK